MKLDSLAGNAALKSQLSAQAVSRGLSHAYLISGPAGSGKATLARLLSAALVCTGPGEIPCGTCPGCKKALGGIHPDVIHVDLLEDKREILVDQARQMRSDAFIRPNEADRKVYVVHHADTMNAYAQNAILKLLEEGPAYAAFLLLCENPGSILPTIRSRCEGLSLTPVSPREAEDWLSARFPDADPARRERAARNCEGILGRAVRELEGEGESETVPPAAQTLLSLAAGGDELALAGFCISLEKWKREDLAALLSAAIGLLREALLIQAGAQAPGGPELAPVAALPQKRLLAWARELEELRRATQFNVGVGHLCGALCAALSR